MQTFRKADPNSSNDLFILETRYANATQDDREMLLSGTFYVGAVGHTEHRCQFKDGALPHTHCGTAYAYKAPSAGRWHTNGEPPTRSEDYKGEVIVGLLRKQGY